jgi:hypothetical protein
MPLGAFSISLAVKDIAASQGPAFTTLTDPDGNPILIDQHV